MNEIIKGFRPILGKIMVVGSSTVGPSRKSGMYYSSPLGNNIIWKVFDASIYAAIGVKENFDELIKEYKNIKINDQESKTIEALLDKGMFLSDCNDLGLSVPLLKKKEILIKIIAKMNKYGLGFTDAIAECIMDGTSDKDRKEKPIYNSNLLNELKHSTVVIINGLSNSKKSSKGSFRTALSIYGKKYDKEYSKLKEKMNICDFLPSTSGACALNETEKISLWVDVIKQYIKL